ncbi:MAG: pyridoxamine 5'-phosphate oxidase family protein [Chromatiales bacterium]|nr:pyridoxamine 5'-phosphate oxidase family protein [Chromatiales bacterium]
MTESNRPKLFAELTAFRDGFRSLELATGNAETPLISYAPYVPDGSGGFCIYISQLAAHTGQLQASGSCSVMLIEAEQDAEQVFARKRLIYSCQAQTIERGTDEWQRIMADFHARFGEFIDMIIPLADFVLFRLTPTGGSYVRGFAQAYQLSGEDLEQLAHINPSKDKGEST